MMASPKDPGQFMHQRTRDFDDFKETPTNHPVLPSVWQSPERTWSCFKNCFGTIHVLERLEIHWPKMKQLANDGDVFLGPF
jgi:glucan biosynthesis protein